MPKERDCAVFNNFGEDIKEARKALALSRRVLYQRTKRNTLFVPIDGCS